MGCDIHAFVEFGSKGDKDKRSWYPFAKVRVSRDYQLFENLAGVRGDKRNAIYPPRGFPTDASWWALGEFTLYIVEDETEAEGLCSRELAESWIASGASRRWDGDRITHPDWHTPSWLTADELREVQSVYADTEEIDWPRIENFADYSDFIKKEVEVSSLSHDRQPKRKAGPNYEIEAVINMMETFQLQGFSARFVFWFDN